MKKGAARGGRSSANSAGGIGSDGSRRDRSQLPTLPLCWGSLPCPSAHSLVSSCKHQQHQFIHRDVIELGRQKVHWTLAVQRRLRWRWYRPREVAFPLARLLKPQFSSSFCLPCPLAPVKIVKTCPNHSSSSGGHSHTTCKCADCLLAIKWSVKAIYIYAVTIWLRSLMDQVQQRSIRSIPTHSTGSSIFTSPKEMAN